MTTVSVHVRPVFGRTRVEGILRWAVLVCLVSGLRASAQEPPVHWLHAGAMPPGAIGSQRLHAGRTVVGILPASADPGSARGSDRTGRWKAVSASRKPSDVLVGHADRAGLSACKSPTFRNNPGVGSLSHGRSHRPPLSAAGPGAALSDSDRADARRARHGGAGHVRHARDLRRGSESSAARSSGKSAKRSPGSKRGRGDDPLVVADGLGRPVAILRIGGRVPTANGPTAASRSAARRCSCTTRPDCPPPKTNRRPSQTADANCATLTRSECADAEPMRRPHDSAVSARQAPRRELPTTRCHRSSTGSAGRANRRNRRSPPRADRRSCADCRCRRRSDRKRDDCTSIAERRHRRRRRNRCGDWSRRLRQPCPHSVGREYATVAALRCATCGALRRQLHGVHAARARRRIPVRRRRLRFAGRRAGRLDHRRPRTGRRHRPLRHGRRPRRRHAQQSRLHLCAAVRRRAPRRQSAGSRTPVYRRHQVVDEQALAKRDDHAAGRLVDCSGTRVAINLGQQPPSLFRQRQQAGGAGKPCRPRWRFTTRSRPTANLQIIRTGQVDGSETGAAAARRADGHRLDRRPSGRKSCSQRKAVAAQSGSSSRASSIKPTARTIPRLRLIKLASTGNALPGEEVEFTLRFDNIGDQVIGNVTIVDNLTTRLRVRARYGQEQRRRQLHHDAQRQRLDDSALGNQAARSNRAKAAFCNSGRGSASRAADLPPHGLPRLAPLLLVRLAPLGSNTKCCVCDACSCRCRCRCSRNFSQATYASTHAKMPASTIGNNP